MKIKLTLSQAIEGYLLEARARHLSPRTIEDYTNGFHKLQAHLGDPPLADIKADHIRRFLADLRTNPVTPAGIAPRPPRRLSKKSVLNVHTALSALWTWAVAEHLVGHNVVHDVARPRPEQPVIEPFTRSDVEAILAACERTQPYTRPGKRQCANARPTAARDRAIILLLLDTGIRAAELAADPRHRTPGLLIQDLDQKNLYIKIHGKGSKSRIVPISPRTSKALWRYLLTRPDAAPTEPLFLTPAGIPLTSGGLLQLIRRLGDRAGVPNAYPHKFRHTFAIWFLRNGGNAFVLQMLLGHSTMEMTKRYLALAGSDAETTHRRASPVTNWNL